MDDNKESPWSIQRSSSWATSSVLYITELLFNHKRVLKDRRKYRRCESNCTFQSRSVPSLIQSFMFLHTVARGKYSLQDSKFKHYKDASLEIERRSPNCNAGLASILKMLKTPENRARAISANIQVQTVSSRNKMQSLLFWVNVTLSTLLDNICMFSSFDFDILTQFCWHQLASVGTFASS